ncbi:MAG: hypothetical protein ABW061_28760 [Polyangiaceae bacterium]
MKRAPLGATEGAVFVEMLIAYLPVMFFFMATWQLSELCAAHLIVLRAASAAARAAAVVLPDDPFYYEDTGINLFEGTRKGDIELAAKMVLAAAPQISDDPTISVSGNSGVGPVKATVVANFHCAAGWVSVVCGAGGVRKMSAEAEYAYQSAKYTY